MNKMKKCLVIAKTPFLSDVKTRLSSKIGIKNTHIFYEMCKNCLEDLTSKLDYDIKIATAEKRVYPMIIGKNLIPFLLREKILQRSKISYFKNYLKFMNQ